MALHACLCNQLFRDNNCHECNYAELCSEDHVLLHSPATLSYMDPLPVAAHLISWNCICFSFDRLSISASPAGNGKRKIQLRILNMQLWCFRLRKPCTVHGLTPGRPARLTVTIACLSPLRLLTCQQVFKACLFIRTCQSAAVLVCLTTLCRDTT